MNAEQLRNAMEKIDDKYISEAEYFDPETMKIPKSPLIYIAPAAAVAASVALITVTNLFTRTDNVPGNSEINNYHISETTVSSKVSVSEESVSAIENFGYTSEITDITNGTELCTSDSQISSTGTVKTNSIVSETRPADIHPQSSVTSNSTNLPYSDTSIYSRPDSTETVTTVSIEETDVPVSIPEETETSDTEPAHKPGQNPGAEEPGVSLVTTEAENQKPGFSMNGPPVPINDYEHLKNTVNEFDINDYPDIYRESYSEMFNAIKSDGFIYAPDDSDGSISLSDIWNIWLLTCSDYQDAGVSCFINYNDISFQVGFYYTDRDVFSSGFGQADYFRRRLEIDFDVSYVIGNGVSVGTFDGRECAYSFIDDNHYYIVRTDASREELIRFIRVFSPEKVSLN